MVLPNALVSKVTHSCPTLCDPMDCSLPGFSVHGIFQVRVLEWVAISSPGDLPDTGIKLGSPALQTDTLPSELPGKPTKHIRQSQNSIGIMKKRNHDLRIFWSLTPTWEHSLTLSPLFCNGGATHWQIPLVTRTWSSSRQFLSTTSPYLPWPSQFPQQLCGSDPKGVSASSGSQIV